MIQGNKMLERVKRFRDKRRRVPDFKPDCPLCKEAMKRKGKKGSTSYWKCLKCKGKLYRNGLFFTAPNPETLDLRSVQIRAQRKELSKRRFIIWAKKQKFLGFKTFELSGEMINFDEYDKDGISFAEKAKITAEQKKREKEAKKKKVPKKKKEPIKPKEEKPTTEVLADMLAGKEE